MHGSRITVPRPQPPPHHSILPLPPGPLVPAAPLQSDIHALGRAEPQRRRDHAVRDKRRVGHAARRILRYRPYPSTHTLRSCPLLTHHLLRLRLGYRRPAQGRVSPQQPPHALCPCLFDDDDDESLRHQITRRRATAGGRSGARAPELSCVDGGRSHAGRHRDRDAARITCARASARTRAGAHGADAVRAGR